MGNILKGFFKILTDLLAGFKTPSVHFKLLSEMETQRISLDDIGQPIIVSNVKRAISRKLKVPEDLLSIIEQVTCRIFEDNELLKPDDTVDVLVKARSRSISAPFMTDDECVVDGCFADDPRVKMPCGHGITQDNLYLHCLTELQKGKSQILCVLCKTPWEFFDIVERADLTLNEQIFFNIKLNKNTISNNSDIFQCPQCCSFLERDDNRNNRVLCPICRQTGKWPYEYCFQCSEPWIGIHKCSNKHIRSILENCEYVTMEYSHISNVPKKRLCPECHLLLEHDGGCKTMTCTCGHVFCFSCLKSKDGKDVGCNTLYEKCEVAPIQLLLD